MEGFIKGQALQEDGRHAKKENECAMKESVALDGKQKPSGFTRVRKMFYHQFSFDLWQFWSSDLQGCRYIFIQTCKHNYRLAWMDVSIARPYSVGIIGFSLDVLPNKISLKCPFNCGACL